MNNGTWDSYNASGRKERQHPKTSLLELQKQYNQPAQPFLLKPEVKTVHTIHPVQPTQSTNNMIGVMNSGHDSNDILLSQQSPLYSQRKFSANIVSPTKQFGTIGTAFLPVRPIVNSSSVTPQLYLKTYQQPYGLPFPQTSQVPVLLPVTDKNVYPSFPLPTDANINSGHVSLLKNASEPVKDESQIFFPVKSNTKMNLLKRQIAIDNGERSDLNISVCPPLIHSKIGPSLSHDFPSAYNLAKNINATKVSKHSHPKGDSNAKKDQAIALLQQQLWFYKDVVSKYVPKDRLDEIHDLELNSGMFSKDETLNLKAVENDKNSSNNSDSEDNSELLKMKMIYDEKGEHINIFDNIYALKNNWYLCSLYKEGSKKNRNKNVYSWLLKFEYANSFQKDQATKFINSMICDENTQGKQQVKFDVLQTRENLENIFTSFKFDGDDTDYSYVFANQKAESKKYDTFLATIQDFVNKNLPNYETLKFLKNFYFTHLYCTMPCFDITALEKCLNEILIVDTLTHQVELELKGSNIKDKLANVTILCLILKISKIVISSKDDSSLEGGFLQGNVLHFVFTLMAIIDPTTYQSEHVISALSLIWSVCSFLPESNYTFDGIEEISTVHLAAFIFKVCMKFKLFDIDKASFIKSDLVRVGHCKKMMFYLIKIIKIEKILNGNKKIIKEIDEDVYLSKMETTGIGSNNELDSFLAVQSSKKIQLISLIEKCYSLFYSDTEDVVDIKKLNESINLLNDFVSQICSFEKWKDPGNELITVGEDKIILDKALSANAMYFDWICFHRSTVLRLYSLLIIGAKNRYITGSIVYNKDMVTNHLFLAFSLSIGTVLMLEKYVKNEYNNHIGENESIALGKCVSFCFNNSILELLSFTVRCYVYKLDLHRLVFNENDQHYKNELQLVDIVLDNLSSILFKTCKIYSKKYRFYYFKSFKLCLFLDFFKQIYEDGTLYNYLFDTKENFDPDALLPERIVNHKLIKKVYNGKYTTVLLKGIYDILTEQQVQNFLQEPDTVNSAATSSDDQKVSGKSEVESVFDEFSFESVFRNMNLDDVNMFDKDFF